MPAGRPRKNAYDRPDRKTIYFDRQTSWALLQYANELNLSVSEVVNSVIKDFLGKAKDPKDPISGLLKKSVKPRVGMHSKHTEMGDKQWENHNRKVAAKRRQAKSENDAIRYAEKQRAWEAGYESGKKSADLILGR